MSGRHPPLRPFARAQVLAPTGAESSQLDRQAIDSLGVPQPVLMENAGRAAAQVASRLFPRGSVAGLIGAGNNGGDALVLLRTLRAWGRDVRAVLVADRPADDPLLHGWDVPLTTDDALGDEAWSDLFGSAEVVVDGILGTGISGAPRDRQATVIDRLNAAGVPVLAIDVPSGVDAETGAVPGSAVRADVTVAFGAPKLGSLLSPARTHAGRLIAVEIGFPPWSGADVTAEVITPLWAQRRSPVREPDTHKNVVGRLTIVAGQPGMAGAAVLATQAALRAGAGLVRVCSAPENREILQASAPEAIYVDASEASAVAAALEAADAVAIGPGLGMGALAEGLVRSVVEGAARPTVVDADALNLAADGGLDLRGLGSTRQVLATPHVGEMSRLLGTSKQAVKDDRVAALLQAVGRFDHVVVLKGAPSLVAGPESRVLVGSQGSSDLAVAGMGDTLTGMCGALLAQGLDALDAGAVGLYLTGRAANIAGRGPSLTPSDVIRWLPEALAERGAGWSDLDLPFVIFDADAAR